MTRRRTEQVLIRRVGAGADGQRRPDTVIVEEPMEIRLDGALVATTMRTPGHDYELAVGFCFGEGLLGGAAVRTVRYCATGPAAETSYNVVTVDTGGVAPAPMPRLGPTNSSCGVCGSVAPTELIDRLEPVRPLAVDPSRLVAAVDVVTGRQELFGATGAVHGAAAFDPVDGSVEVVREDIGRHNAVDKVVGRLQLDGMLPASGKAMFVSGRASFEMVQKAWAAGFSALVAVSAPSSLAVELADAAGMVLVGFVRDGAANLYADRRR